MKEEIKYINNEGHVFSDKEACILSELGSDTEKIAYALREIFANNFPPEYTFTAEAANLENILRKGCVINDND